MKIKRIDFHDYVTPPGSQARTLTIAMKEYSPKDFGGPMATQAEITVQGIIVTVEAKDGRVTTELYPWTRIRQVGLTEPPKHKDR